MTIASNAGGLRGLSRGGRNFKNRTFPLTPGEPVKKQKKLVAEIRKNPEKFKGVPETAAYAFKAPLKNSVARAVPFFSEHLEKVAAPEAEFRIKPVSVSGDPEFAAPDTLAREKQGRRNLAYGLDNRRLPVLSHNAAKTPHYVKPGKCRVNVFFSPFQNLDSASQKVKGMFLPLKKTKEAYHKFERHIPEHRLSGQKSGAAYKAF
jgi:hypothetical protein